MKFLFWRIIWDERSLTRLQWLLFKWFGIKPTEPCGNTKYSHGYYCHQATDEEHCYLIHDSDEWASEIRCKCCDTPKICSNHHKDFSDLLSW